jgi:hypothetical protein
MAVRSHLIEHRCLGSMAPLAIICKFNAKLGATTLFENKDVVRVVHSVN